LSPRFFQIHTPFECGGRSPRRRTRATIITKKKYDENIKSP